MLPTIYKLIWSSSRCVCDAVNKNAFHFTPSPIGDKNLQSNTIETKFKSTTPNPTGPTPALLIKKYPVTLHLRYLFCDIPAIIEFKSAKEIPKEIPFKRKELLMDAAKTGHAILSDQTEKKTIRILPTML